MDRESTEINRAPVCANNGVKKLGRLFSVEQEDGTRIPFDFEQLLRSITWACTGYNDASPDLIVEETIKNVFDGITKTKLAEAQSLAAATFIECDPLYDHVASRLLLKQLYKEVVGCSIFSSDFKTKYQAVFMHTIRNGIKNNIFDKRLGEFDLAQLAESICPERDSLIGYMGMRTLYERYFYKFGKKRWELPQTFWMRVAIGLSINEKNKTEQARSFYLTISAMDYIPSTPTLLHAGLVRSQLSSCFLGTVNDDLKHIFKCVGDNAQLSKWSGGVAYDWTNVRATGALVKSIQIESQGLIPFLKISNDVTAAINRSGKRRSASCVYLEVWHLDYEDFLDLRRNTGDERRRTHDINTASWVPDLFMKRMLNDDQWTLFSPDEVPDLHHMYGKAFEVRYKVYEEQTKQGKIRKFKIVKATKLWRKMLSRLFETGHPWITFKDACNIRSPQDHVGVIHNSNLCTEITLNTSADETAVCNLGSINLAKHISNGVLDKPHLQKTVRTAIRMLDNVIDLNFYPTKEAKTANTRHRPIGLGLMGFQDALYMIDVNFDSQEALNFADQTQEFIAYHAIATSADLAKEYAAYSSYTGSKWDRNIFPQDTIDLLEKERGIPVNVRRSSVLNWKPVREKVRQYGMRNSNVMAIAPTATISTIAGCYPCIEPIYKNLYVKANMSGEFTVVNRYLIQELKAKGLWNTEMLDQLKYYDGSIQNIDLIPQKLKNKFKSVFEIDPEFLVEITAARGKSIDQSISHNVFMDGVSGKMLHKIYVKGWQAGLKTFYYLRTQAATQNEKSTLDAKKYGYTQKRSYMSANKVVMSPVEDVFCNEGVDSVVRACSSFQDSDCEACQ